MFHGYRKAASGARATAETGRSGFYAAGSSAPTGKVMVGGRQAASSCVQRGTIESVGGVGSEMGGDHIMNCEICFDDVLLSRGVTCSGGSDEEGEVRTHHFLCRGCFISFLQSHCKDEMGTFQRRGHAQLCCPIPRCPAAPFSAVQVFNQAPDLFENYLALHLRFSELQHVDRLEKQFKEAIASALMRLTEQDDQARKAGTERVARVADSV